MRLLLALIVAIAIALGSGLCGCGASDPVSSGLTAGAVIYGAEEMQRTLADLAMSVDATTKVAIDRASAALQTAIHDLGKEAEGKIKAPIETLSYSGQELARSLDRSTSTLQRMVDDFNADTATNIGVFAAAIQTTTMELADRSWLTWKKHTPRIFYFQFVKEKLPSRVPLNGGTLDLIGYKLYRGNPPQVDLLEGGQVITPLTPTRKDDHALSLTLDREIVAAHPGDVLDIRVRPDPKQTDGKADLIVHLVVPEYINAEIKVTAYVAYTCNGVEERQLAPQTYRERNGSKDNNLAINKDLHFTDMPTGARMYELGATRHPDSFRDEGVVATISQANDGVIHIAGILGHGKSERDWRGVRKMVREGLYHTTFAPWISREVNYTYEATGTGSISLDEPQSVVLVNIPVPCAVPDTQVQQGISFWYVAQVFVGGQSVGRSFTAPRVQVGSQGGIGATYRFRGLTLTPGCDSKADANGAVQVHVNVVRDLRR